MFNHIIYYVTIYSSTFFFNQGKTSFQGEFQGFRRKCISQIGIWIIRILELYITLKLPKMTQNAICIDCWCQVANRNVYHKLLNCKVISRYIYIYISLTHSHLPLNSYPTYVFSGPPTTCTPTILPPTSALLLEGLD